MNADVFMMGEFEAVIPSDRLYAKNHMWAQQTDKGFRFGFSAYAVRLLQDVYFLDWEIDAPCEISPKQEMGSIESKKAESVIYSPCQGHLEQFNPSLLNDPSAINVDKYGEGWLFELVISNPDFLDAAQYIEHLGNVWQDAQRTIKGQMNQ
ncbi:MAG: glycine cleavage system protein H [Pirellulaceae bacterium]|jgi:glycine cleavage system H protein|nr:glycine cleavage system protein H [Mariniblastus sp.]MDB4756523.1 glycine cleavage system protein H [Mariniblastus sp.]MDG2471203.1 glycine cleavage system protein H [Pirellulaceae bacterium]